MGNQSSQKLLIFPDAVVLKLVVFRVFLPHLQAFTTIESLICMRCSKHRLGGLMSPDQWAATMAAMWRWSCQLAMLGMPANTIQQLLTRARTLTLAQMTWAHLLWNSAGILRTLLQTEICCTDTNNNKMFPTSSETNVVTVTIPVFQTKGIIFNRMWKRSIDFTNKQDANWHDLSPILKNINNNSDKHISKATGGWNDFISWHSQQWGFNTGIT